MSALLHAWTQVGTLPTTLESSAAVRFKDALWLTGGWDGVGISNKVLRSLDDGATWTQVGTLPAAVYGHSLVEFNGRMWLVGGGLDVGVSDQVFSSDDGETWTPEASLPQPITQHGCVVLEDKIWVVSGYSSGGGASRKVFTSAGDVWSEVGVDAFPLGLQAFPCVVFGETIWTFGGFLAGLATDTLKIFKLSSDRVTWNEVGADAMPLKLEGHAAFVFDDVLFLAAGINDNIGVTRKVWKTLDGLAWEEEGTDAIPSPRSYMPYVQTEERAWIFGGYDVQADADIDQVISTTPIVVDSQAVENALVDKLRADAKLMALLPDGVFFGVADNGCKKFCVVSTATSHDEPMFQGRAYEDYNFLVKAVVLNDRDGTARKAAARIDKLLDPPKPERATLEIEGYRLMVMRRIDRVRYPDVDPSDPSIVWQHRGGHYQVMVYPQTKA